MKRNRKVPTEEKSMERTAKTPETGNTSVKRKATAKGRGNVAFFAAVCIASLCVGMTALALGKTSVDLTSYISYSPKEATLSLFDQIYTAEPHVYAAFSEWAICAEKAGKLMLADKSAEQIQKAAAIVAAAGKHIGTGIGAILRTLLYGNL